MRVSAVRVPKKANLMRKYARLERTSRICAHTHARAQTLSVSLTHTHIVTGTVPIDKLSSCTQHRLFSAGAPAGRLQSGREQRDSAISRTAASLLRGNAVQLWTEEQSECVRSGVGAGRGDQRLHGDFAISHSGCTNAKVQTPGRTARPPLPQAIKKTPYE